MRNLSLILGACLWLLPPAEAAETQAVVDHELIAKTVRAHAALAEQLNGLNRSQTEQLTQLRAQTGLLNTQFAAGDKDGWEQVTGLYHRTASVLAAGSAAWDRLAAVATLLETEQKAAAWSACLGDEACSFAAYQARLNEDTLQSATALSAHARDMSRSFRDDLEELTALSERARRSVTLNDSLDALLRLTAHSALSLTALNDQLAALVTLTAQNTALARYEQRGQYRQTRNFVNPQLRYSSAHVDLKVSRHAR